MVVESLAKTTRCPLLSGRSPEKNILRHCAEHGRKGSGYGCKNATLKSSVKGPCPGGPITYECGEGGLDGEEVLKKARVSRARVSRGRDAEVEGPPMHEGLESLASTRAAE